MILKASQRGGGKQLALHLLKTEENEHVEIHEVSGFVSDDVLGAFKEAHAAAKGTRCRQYLFSVSLNPPPQENVSIDVFEAAVARIEESNSLTGQPRVIVFHEKEGRRHAHAVWSRIDGEEMKAVQLSHFKTKLREISKELYLEHGWQMPRGLMDSKARDPRNFTLAEWQQAKRDGRNAREDKATIQECWAVSDSKAAFTSALEERGFTLAKGDRRAHVALPFDGSEPISIARAIGKKTKDVRARLGDGEELASIEQARQRVAEQIAPRLKTHIEQARLDAAKEIDPLEDQRRAMALKHTGEREKLDAGQRTRAEAETRERAARLRKGVMGIWDRLTGTHAKTNKQNELEALAAIQRDREQRHALIQAQLKDRQKLQEQICAARERRDQIIKELHRDAANYRLMQNAPKPRDAFERLEALKAKEPPAVQKEFAQRSEDNSPQRRLERLKQKVPRTSRERDLDH